MSFTQGLSAAWRSDPLVIVLKALAKWWSSRIWVRAASSGTFRIFFILTAKQTELLFPTARERMCEYARLMPRRSGEGDDERGLSGLCSPVYPGNSSSYSVL
jgi:hypothetical protein